MLPTFFGTALFFAPTEFWTSRSVGTPNDNLYSIAYGNDIFIAVGNSAYCWVSSDGISWTSHIMPASGFHRAICWGGGHFVVGGDYADVYRTIDGITWTTHTVAASNQGIRAICNGGGGVFVAVGVPDAIDGHQVNVTYNNCASWTGYATNNVDDTYVGVCTINSGYVAISNTSTQANMILYSSGPAGDNWTASTHDLGVFNQLSGIAYDVVHNTVVTVALTGDPTTYPTTVSLSTDNGGSFTKQTLPLQINREFSSICCDTTGILMVVSRFNGPDRSTMYSLDGGYNWIYKNGANNNYYNGVIYGNGKFVAVSEVNSDAAHRIMTSGVP